MGIGRTASRLGEDVAVWPLPVFTSLHGYQRTWAGADAVAGLTLLAIALPEQLATSRLAGMPPITGFYAFIAGTVLIARRSPRSLPPVSWVSPRWDRRTTSRW